VYPPPSASSSSPVSLSHSVTESLLHSLADPEASLASVARQFNIPLGSLTLWLARPDTQARVRELESGAATHIRLAASLNLSSAVRVLVRILDDFHTLARSNPDPKALPNDPNYIRASERARKAAYHLYRLSRLVPIDAPHLATARSLVEANRVACLHEGQACELTYAPSPSPSHGCAPGGTAMPPDRAAPAPQVTIAHSSSRRAIEVDAAAASMASAPSPSGSAPPTTSPSSPLRDSAPSAALRVENSSSSPPRSADASAPSAFASLEELNAYLEQLAASLGIDTSDIDENAPLPPEFLALFPPDVADFLAPEPTESPPRSAHVIARAER
jgi:hypothetical protein